jgi:hypothetical protein
MAEFLFKLGVTVAAPTLLIMCFFEGFEGEEAGRVFGKYGDFVTKGVPLTFLAGCSLLSIALLLLLWAA